MQTLTNNIRPNQTTNESFAEYQFCTENNVLTTALTQLLSTAPTQNSTINDNNNKVSIVSAPKNVKFIIPLARSGITSNESTFGVIESTTRTITHVKDIFPLNPLTQSPSDSEQQQQQQPQRTAMTKSDSEEVPLLSNENSDDK